MRKVASLLLCLFIFFGLPDLNASAQEPVLTLEVNVNEPVYLNGSATVQIKISSLALPLSGIEFALQFDSALLTPVITGNANDEMNAFLKKSPQNSWEQVCRYDSATASYILRFYAPDGAVDESKLVKTADDFLIEIPFTAKAEGETAVMVADSSIIGVDKDLNVVSGIGSEKKIAITPSDKITLKTASSLTLYMLSEKVYITGVREKTAVSDFLNSFINTNLTLLDKNGKPYAREICGTGMKICLYDGSTLLDSVTLVVKGDLDGDGTISPIDYLLLKKYYQRNLQLNDTQLQAGYLYDMNEISPITILRLKRHILGFYNIY
jgi:hypothetical protein